MWHGVERAGGEGGELPPLFSKPLNLRQFFGFSYSDLHFSYATILDNVQRVNIIDVTNCLKLQHTL